jgi:hypothetical protein
LCNLCAHCALAVKTNREVKKNQFINSDFLHIK